MCPLAEELYKVSTVSYSLSSSFLPHFYIDFIPVSSPPSFSPTSIVMALTLLQMSLSTPTLQLTAVPVHSSIVRNHCALPHNRLSCLILACVKN